MPAQTMPIPPLEVALENAGVYHIERDWRNRLRNDHNSGDEHETLGLEERFKIHVGVTYRTWCRWKKQGYIPFDAADRVATSLGSHIDIIWRDEP